MVTSVELTIEQEKAVAELRDRVINKMPREWAEDNFVYLRFLKARNWNLELAENMLTKCLEWRKMYQLNTILTDFKPPEVCCKYFSQSLLGYSKAGQPVRYTALGNVDCKNILKSTNMHKVLKTCMQLIEFDGRNLRNRKDRFGRPVTQGILIINLEHLSLAKATHKKTVETFIAGVKAFQDNFPEALHSIYILNASHFFTLAFEAIKSFLADSVLNKLQVFAQDYEEALLKVIDVDVLPAFLGGNRTDPDGNPYCKTILKHGGTVPKAYYAPKVPLWQQAGCRKVVVDRMSKSVIEVDVPTDGSILEWQFQSKNYDIGFGLAFGGEQLIPVIKIETENEPETSICRCEHRGVYTIIFDNTYSWMHSKEVYYKTKVMTVKEYESTLEEQRQAPWFQS